MTLSIRHSSQKIVYGKSLTDTITMAIETELADRCVPINSLKKSSSIWVIRVLVIGIGAIKSFNNGKNEGLRWILTFVDEEGTKIQAIIFTKFIAKWKETFEQNKTYYIINGIANAVNPKYQSVHKELEILFSDATDVQECQIPISTVSFSNSFVSFEEASEYPVGTIFDILGIVVRAKPSMGGIKKRKEIVLMDERYDCKTITLWGELAEKEGDMLETLILEKPVVALCDVKITEYQGEFGISTTLVSNILINPSFEKGIALQKWLDYVKAQNKDITLEPTKLIKDARLVKLVDIIHNLFDNGKVTYCKFNAKVEKILNPDDPWYSSCKKCYKKVEFQNNTATCPRCGNVAFEERYLLKFDVLDKHEEHSTVTLFEGARYLLECDVTTFRESIAEKKEDSIFYRKLLSSKDREFTFLVRIDAKNERDRAGRRVVAEEIHEVGKVGAIEIEDEGIKSRATMKKKTKKTGEDNNSLALKKIKIEKN